MNTVWSVGSAEKAFLYFCAEPGEDARQRLAKQGYGTEVVGGWGGLHAVGVCHLCALETLGSGMFGWAMLSVDLPWELLALASRSSFFLFPFIWGQLCPGPSPHLQCHTQL